MPYDSIRELMKSVHKLLDKHINCTPGGAFLHPVHQMRAFLLALSHGKVLFHYLLHPQMDCSETWHKQSRQTPPEEPLVTAQLVHLRPKLRTGSGQATQMEATAELLDDQELLCQLYKHLGGKPLGGPIMPKSNQLTHWRSRNWGRPKKHEGGGGAVKVFRVSQTVMRGWRL